MPFVNGVYSQRKEFYLEEQILSLKNQPLEGRLKMVMVELLPLKVYPFTLKGTAHKLTINF